MTTFGKVLIFVFLVILGGGIYGVIKFRNAIAPLRDTVIEITSTTTPVLVATTTIPAKKIPFYQLLQEGGSYTCTVTRLIGDITSKGTLHFSKNKLRAEFITKVGGNDIKSTLLLLDDYVYTWSSMASTTGWKVKKLNSATTGVSATSSTYTFDATQIGDYECETWTVDETIFLLPKGMAFSLAK